MSAFPVAAAPAAPVAPAALYVVRAWRRYCEDVSDVTVGSFADRADAEQVRDEIVADITRGDTLRAAMRKLMTAWEANSPFPASPEEREDYFAREGEERRRLETLLGVPFWGPDSEWVSVEEVRVTSRAEAREAWIAFSSK